MSTLRRLLITVVLALGLAGVAVAQRVPTPDTDAFWYGSKVVDGKSTPTLKVLYFFSPSCPHCQEAKPFVDALEAMYPWLEVVRYNVRDSKEDAQFYVETARAIGQNAMSVPGIAFCKNLSIGYDTAETTGRELANSLRACHEKQLAQLAKAAR